MWNCFLEGLYTFIIPPEKNHNFSNHILFSDKICIYFLSIKIDFFLNYFIMFYEFMLFAKYFLWSLYTHKMLNPHLSKYLTNMLFDY